MSMDDKDEDDPKAVWKRRLADQPDPARLKYSDSPYAPDWARRPEDRAARTPARQLDPVTEPVTPAPDDLRPQRIADMPVMPAPAALGFREAPPARQNEEENEHFRPDVEWFESLLWRQASDDVRVYAIMDGHWAHGLYGSLLNSPDLSWAHMFQGDVALNNVQNAPFIIALKRGHKLLRWLVEEGWGNGWGSYFTASTEGALLRYGPTRWLPPDMAPSNEERVKLCSLTEGMADPLWLMRNHFRRFSDVEFEDDGRIVDFRYYDPATLRVYLPSCNNQELSTFFGPVRYFLAEGYCEVESLNRPEEIYHFALNIEPFATAKDRGGSRRVELEGARYNAVTRKKETVPRSASSKECNGRERGLYPMIRTAQLNDFYQSRQDISIKKVAISLKTILRYDKRGVSLSELFELAKDIFPRAKSYNICTEREFLYFLYCSVVYGKNFYNKHVHIRRILEENALRKNPLVAFALEEFATATY